MRVGVSSFFVFLMTACISVTAHDANMRGFRHLRSVGLLVRAQRARALPGPRAVGGGGRSEPQAFHVSEAAGSHPCSADHTAVGRAPLIQVGDRAGTEACE